MWKKISLAAVVVAVAVATAVMVAGRPSTYRVERSVALAAPPQVVMAQLSDLQHWRSWSPWEPAGEEVQRRFGGRSSAAGSTYYWSSEGAQGRLTLIGATAERLDLEVELEQPRPRTADLELRLAPEAGGTRVTWAVTGEHASVQRVLGLARKAAMAEIETSLPRLKAFVEAQPRIEPYRLERSLSVAAPPAVVLARLVDLHRWSAWSPWDGAEAEMRRSYGGPKAGAGSTYYWSSSHDDAKGRITVLGSGPDKVELELELEQPRRTTCDMELTLVAEGAGTRVIWSMTGEEEAARATAATTEKVMGTDLEKGLARLKALVEAKATAPAKPAAKSRLSQR